MTPISGRPAGTRPAGGSSRARRRALAVCPAVAAVLTFLAVLALLVGNAEPAVAVAREPVRPVSTAAWVLSLVYLGIAVSAAVWLVTYVRRGRW